MSCSCARRFFSFFGFFLFCPPGGLEVTFLLLSVLAFLLRSGCFQGSAGGCRQPCAPVVFCAALLLRSWCLLWCVPLSWGGWFCAVLLGVFWLRFLLRSRCLLAALLWFLLFFLLLSEGVFASGAAFWNCRCRFRSNCSRASSVARGAKVSRSVVGMSLGVSFRVSFSRGGCSGNVLFYNSRGRLCIE